jgi:hypothetical protein
MLGSDLGGAFPNWEGKYSGNLLFVSNITSTTYNFIIVIYINGGCGYDKI